MMHRLLSTFDKAFGFDTAQAHCDIPCKIYEPQVAIVAALSVIRLMDLIAELEANETLTLSQQATLARLVAEKETHAKKVKDEVTTIWGDYFKQPQFAAFPDTSELVHQIMLAGSACKQHIDRDKGVALLELVNELAKRFWETKNITTFTAPCPYPPALPVVYPKLV